jgi:hypothetical protein
LYIHSKPILLASVTLPVQRHSSVTSNTGIELVGETDDEHVGDIDIDSVCKAVGELVGDTDGEANGDLVGVLGTTLGTTYNHRLGKFV